MTKVFLYVFGYMLICECVRAYELRHPQRNTGIHIKNADAVRSPSVPRGPNPMKPEYVPTFEAHKHYKTMQEQGRCGTPRSLVVDVQKIYPNISIKYLPSCTTLYRCDGEAGCCGEGKVCRAATKEKIQLYFYVTPKHINEHNRGSSIVKLSFTNHTSCVCEEDLEGGSEHKDVVGEEVKRRRGRERINFEATNDDDLDEEEDDEEEEESCKKCPGPFSIRKVGNSCSCDCFDRDKECLRMKRGVTRLEGHDQRCVYDGRCNVPQCSAGDFDVDLGGCPEDRHHLRNRHQHHHKKRNHHRKNDY